MNRYELLTENLKKAVEAAKQVAAETDEGGTCNFDSCILYLPRYNEEKTVQAIKAAGLTGHKSQFFYKVGYIISNPIMAQGNCGTAQAEKLAEVMKDAGYASSVYYAID